MDEPENIKPRDRADYVSNKLLFETFVKHIKDVAECEAANKPKPPMPPYIAEAIIKISRRYANRPNFISYSYRDEMISDAIETCCKYYLKFNPEKSNNPFAYITSCCHNAFLQRINKEKKQTSIKSRYIASAVDSDFVVGDSSGEDDEYKNNMVEFLRENSVFVDSIAEKKAKKTKKTNGTTLEDFFGDKNEQ